MKAFQTLPEKECNEQKLAAWKKIFKITYSQ
jgi:hypothetical protein